MNLTRTLIAAASVLCIASPALAAVASQVMEGHDSAAYPHYYDWPNHVGLEGDWAPGYWKGECPQEDWQGNDGDFNLFAISGISGDYGNHMLIHGLQCASPGSFEVFDNYSLPPYGGQPVTIPISGTWTNYDVGGAFPNGDWDPYYPKATCGADMFVGGVAQNASGVAWIQCYAASPNNLWKRADKYCYSEIFGVNMPQPYDPRIPNQFNNRDSPRGLGDWDTNYQKGSCAGGGAVAGISHNRTDTGDFWAGGIHAILCCPVTPWYGS